MIQITLTDDERKYLQLVLLAADNWKVATRMDRDYDEIRTVSEAVWVKLRVIPAEAVDPGPGQATRG